MYQFAAARKSSQVIHLVFVSLSPKKLNQLWRLILATHLLVDLTPNVTTAFALASTNIKEIPIEVADRNVYLIVIAQELKPVYETNVKILALVLVVKMQNARS